VATRSGPGQVRFRERAELLDFLLEVGAVTSETLDLDKLLSSVAEIIKEVIPYELFAILLYSERTRTLRMRYSIGHREEVARNLSIEVGEGITGAAAATRHPILVRDVRVDKRYLNALDAVRAELAAPMLIRGKLVGVIDLQSTTLSSFTEQDRALLALLASRVAAAIDNARLYRRVHGQNRTLRVLAHLSQEFSSILDLDELLTKVGVTIRALINFDAFSIFMVEEERKMLKCRFSQRYDEVGTVESVPFGEGLIGAAVDSRTIVRVGDVLKDPRYIPSHEDIRSEIAVPLILHDRVSGVMNLESVRYGFFTEDHARALSLLAPQIATSVENARLYEELGQREQRMEEDLKAAYKLQSVLLPRGVPEIRGLEAALRSRPARQITGDLYDFFEQSEDYTLIAFGDVSGKGAAAAIYGALISGLLRTLAPRKRMPAQLMKLMNEALLERKVDAQYATLSLLLWNPATRTFTISAAGTLPPLILRNGKILEVKVTGVPIGLLEDREYEQAVFETTPKDVVVLYSDGVEDQLADDSDYGRSRVEKVLLANAKAPPSDIAKAIFTDIDEFRGSTTLTDDQSVVVMRAL
jgi:sigma-B regulation protein RsbU (phosphoserine phosphatase)